MGQSPEKPINLEVSRSSEEENLLENVDELVLFVNRAHSEIFGRNIKRPKNTIPDLSTFNKAKELAEKHIDNWGRRLFAAARSAQGAQKIAYAVALQRLESFVVIGRYQDMLTRIPTNYSAIKNLINQGQAEVKKAKKEKSVISKVRKLFLQKPS